MSLTPKMVKNIFGIIFMLTAVKNHTSNYADSPFGPIIVHMQMHPILHLPINNIIQCIFEIFQIIVDFQKLYFFLFLNTLQIQTDKYQNVPNFASNFTL